MFSYNVETSVPGFITYSLAWGFINFWLQCGTEKASVGHLNFLSNSLNFLKVYKIKHTSTKGRKETHVESVAKSLQVNFETSSIFSG